MTMIGKRRLAMVAVLMGGTSLAGAPSAAATINWVNAAVGDWFTAANWDGDAVPVAGDTARINNGGTAEATGTTVPTATALDVGAGAGTVSGAVTTEADLALGNGFNALRVGVATDTGADATGTLSVGGSVTGIAPATAAGTVRIGQATGDGAQAEGVVTVGGDLAANAAFIGFIGTGNGQTATGSLEVGGNLSGLSQVGAGVFSQDATADGTVTVTGGDLTPSTGLFVVGQTFGAGTEASGAVEVQMGTIRTTDAIWAIGNAREGQATGRVEAAAVDSTGGVLNGLFVGSASNGAVSEGTLTLGTGDVRTEGDASIGVADVTNGATAQGTATLGGALVGEGGELRLSVGRAIGQVFQGAPGEATGALTAAGVAGFRTVDVGVARGVAGLGPEADGTLALGAGGLVNGEDPGGALRIGVAEAASVNLVLAVPGPVATGAATVAGDVTGYNLVEVGKVENAGTATGTLEMNGGTMATAFLDIGVVQPPSSNLLVTDAAATASGTVTVTDGEIVVASPVEIFPGSTRIGFTSLTGDDFDPTAAGALALTRARFESGVVLAGFGDGAEATVTAVDSEIAVGDMVVGGGGGGQVGSARLTLTDSTLTATANATTFRTGTLTLGGVGTSLMATGSDLTLDGNLSVLSGGLGAGQTAQMAMTDGTLSVGGNLSIGEFDPASRGEVSLTGTEATVGGNLFVGRSANVGTLFGEALLHLDGSLMDVTGGLVLDIGGELRFGIGGFDRGLGGYGALFAGSGDLRGGTATVDFAGLTGPLGFQTAVFDLIALSNGLGGDFGLVSLLNVPTGYLASHAFIVDGDSDLWRVTLSRDVAPVPLPAGAWLLLSGLAGLGLLRRSRRR